MSGIAAATLSDSYLTILWRIKNCSLTPPRKDMSLVSCDGVSTKFYYSGSLYLGIDRPLIESLVKADVVIFGNSRTQRTFSSAAIDEYFHRKNLRYFILASEGSGFRFSQLILERLKIKPKIVLVSNESYYVDIVDDTNREVVRDPDRFYPVLSTFSYAKEMVRRICASGPTFLQNLYCHGLKAGGWRGTLNGALYHQISEYGTTRILIPRVPVPDTTDPKLISLSFNLVLKNARKFLPSPSVHGSCVINYLVPSSYSNVDLARGIATAIDVPFIFPEIKDYYTHDSSHMVPESSERWSSDFVLLADPYIDRCLKTEDSRG